MKIVSYNVNGIRAAMNKGLAEWVQQESADVYCFQEIKANREDIDTSVFEKLGYHAYWHPAQKKGYSGVGILTRQVPDRVIFESGMEQADAEGRILQMEIGSVKLINTYFPSGSSGDERQVYKMQFLEEYLAWMKKQFPPISSPLIIAGDYNICHQAIDIHDPKGNKDSSGFLPEEREWMDRFFASGMTDTFRTLNPEPHQYTWWSFRANARNNNKGWRIDYINVSEPLKQHISDARIYPDARHSDHCPVMLNLSI
ncbi:MAG TPA: exodeoxyribonuclease III [Chitinophagaceae bacterium]|nr:exodeoxyribonuclease III [Chitinophagaceae bacterium]